VTVRHAAAVSGSALLVFGLLGTGLYFALRSRPAQQDTSLIGVVLMKDSDPRKQAPIPNVIITGFSPGTAAQTKSDAGGFFRLTFHPGAKPGQPIRLSFIHPDFKPLEMPVTATDHIQVAELQSNRPEQPKTAAAGPEVKLSDVRVRYTTKMSSTVDQPMTVTTFMAVNKANVPCDNHQPCSPDGLWKAGVGSLKLEAPEGSQFRDVRVSCIAGPCPFTKIDSDTRREDGRVLELSAMTWADTATFLVEADVVHPVISDLVRQSYPVIFGPELSFTLPDSAEGPSIEAEVNNTPIVFPLGPDLYLSWATCSVKQQPDKSKLYSCELKPGYRFQTANP
jgi:hypothetical protein